MIIIHRGTHQIGGCVTEIKSNSGTRIVIDIGANLPSLIDEDEKPDLELDGLTYGEPKFDAVFVTHYHGDHIGLFNKILPYIPIYIGKDSKEIFKILESRLIEINKASKEDLDKIENFKTYKILKKIRIKDITVMPIEVDHSAFNAHMLLIECDGKKILHTGDFRIHGQRGKTVLPTLEKYIGKVDCLICEGTTLSRNEELLITEFELQHKAEELFKENKYSFVLCSSTNIDRIAALKQSAIKCGRLFICDNYQKNILLYIDKIARSDYYKFKGKVRTYNDNLFELMKSKGFVMLVRANYNSKLVMKKFPESIFIYSQWKNYLDKENTRYKYLQDFVPEDKIYLHTSGHANKEAIKQVCQIVKPKFIIPIHGENPSAFEDMQLTDCKIILANDGEEINI